MPKIATHPTTSVSFPMRFIGVDPGASGGLACISGYPQVRQWTVETIKMPETDADLLEWLRERSFNACAVLERVGGFIQGNPTPGSAMFNFGANFGALRMALTAAAIPFDVIIPAKWQRGVGVTPRGKDEKKTSHKNRLKARAQQLFPGVKITLAVADALLIAAYCRQTKGTERCR